MININISTIVGIITFMGRIINATVSAESFNTSGPDLAILPLKCIEPKAFQAGIVASSEYSSRQNKVYADFF